MSLMFRAIMMMGCTVIARILKVIVRVSTPKLGSGVDGDAWAHEPDFCTPSIYFNCRGFI